MIGRIIGLLFVLFQRNSLKLSRIAVFKRPQSVTLRSMQSSIASSTTCFASSISPSDSLTHTKSSGYNIRTCKNLIAVFFKRQYHDQNTVLRQMLSVAKNDISDITNTQSVY